MGRASGGDRILRLAALLLSASILITPGIPNTVANAHGAGRAAPPTTADWSNDSLIVPWHDPTVQPSLAACPDGNVFAVWVDGRASAPAIYFKKLDPEGRTIVEERQVWDAGIDFNNSKPVALSGPDGTLHVLWAGHLLGDRCLSICHRSFHADGSAATTNTENLLNTTLAIEGAWIYRNLTASFLPDGSISIAFEASWNDLINTIPPENYPTIGWMRISSEGTKLAEAGLNSIPRDAAESTKQRNPAVSADSGGRTHVFWLDLVQQAGPVLRWSIVNGTGAGVQGFMVLDGQPAPSLATVDGPGNNMSVVFVDRGASRVRMASYPAAGTPVNASPRTVYYFDINQSGQISPIWSVRAVRYGEGNAVIACEGEALGDFGPNIIPFSIGLFEVEPGGGVILSEPQFINEDFDSALFPAAPPPHLLPAIAASRQGELLICWQLKFPTLAGRPLGLHMIHTAQQQSSPGIWFETLSPADNFTIPEGETLQFSARAKSNPDTGGIEYYWYIDGLISIGGGARTQFNFSANYSSAGKHAVQVMALQNFTPEPLRAYHTWNLNILNVDRPPVIMLRTPPGPDVRFNIDRPDVFYIQARDPDGDTLSYSWSIDGIAVVGAGMPSLVPDSITRGARNITVTVSAGGLNATASWNARVLGPSGAVTVSEGPPMMAFALLAILVATAVTLLLVRRLRMRKG